MERTWVLNSYAPTRYPGVRLDRDWSVWTYHGEELPVALVDYVGRSHSWERFVQDSLNEVTLFSEPRRKLRLRSFQQREAERIATAHGSGSPGYLLNHPVGSGKTPTSIGAVDSIGAVAHKHDRQFRVLVMSFVSMGPAWCAAIDQFSTREHRWVVINPERLWWLFRHPTRPMHQVPASERLQTVAQIGISRVSWDVVIVDESQMLAQADSLRAQIVRRLDTRFTIYASATPFSTPLETAYVSNLIAYALQKSPPVDVTDGYLEWLRAEAGLHVKSSVGGRWDYGRNTHDVNLLTALLYRRGVGSCANVEDLGLPRQLRTLLPITLTPAEQTQYHKAWVDFLAEHRSGFVEASEPGHAMTVVLRNMQKASLLKAPHIAQIVLDYVERGNQVIVPMFFLESVFEVARLVAKGMKRRQLPGRVVEMTGADNTGPFDRTGHDRREKKRQAFQMGAAVVAVLNAHEGINLQAGELNVGGSGQDGTTTPRVTVLADVLTGGKRFLQAEGRGHRNGQESLAVYAYADDTAEQYTLAKVFESMANTRALSGANDDAESLMELAAQVRRSGIEELVIGAGRRRENSVTETS